MLRSVREPLESLHGLQISAPRPWIAGLSPLSRASGPLEAGPSWQTWSADSLAPATELTATSFCRLANGFRSCTYLLPPAGLGPAVRLSEALICGSYSEVRLGLDEHGKRSVWRKLRVSHDAIPPGEETTALNGKNLTSFGALEREVSALQATGGPLVPTRAFIAWHGLHEPHHIYLEQSEGQADLFDLSAAFFQIDAADHGFAQQPWVAPPAELVGHRPNFSAAVMLVARELTTQLTRLHHRGWLHRDLKPENILWMRDDRVQLCDLNLAVHCDDRLGMQQMIGTAHYVAPELCAGWPEDVGSPVDIWGLGLTLLDLLLPGDRQTSVLHYQRHDGIETTIAALSALQRARGQHWSGPHEQLKDLFASACEQSHYLADLVFFRLLLPNPWSRPTAIELRDELTMHVPLGGNSEKAGIATLTAATTMHHARKGQPNFASAAFALSGMPPRPWA